MGIEIQPDKLREKIIFIHNSDKIENLKKKINKNINTASCVRLAYRVK